MARKPLTARQIRIRGVVQGVGFRPFIFGLARSHGLAGLVSNTSEGVSLVVEGDADCIDRFIREIPEKKPALSRISAMDASPEPVAGLTGFKIVQSHDSGERFTLISPDVCVCDDCLAEMLDPEDPRFNYPFINCTNCGPRYTIIRDIPYDRPKTSMARFEMCSGCRAEYEDPLDRRFHAQPNACPVCGPTVFLTDNRGNRVDSGPGEALAQAGKLLKEGKILAVKGLGGFHLAVDAANETAVSLLRRRKGRPDKPFALMAASGERLGAHVRIGHAEMKLLTSFHRPIVLLEKIRPGTNAVENRGVESGRAVLAPSLAPGNACLGVMLPYTPLHYLLLSKGPEVLVMTSGNRSGEPLSIDNDDALDAFGHIADYFLLHNRGIYFRVDDSIARVQKGRPRFLRRSRGYAPLPLDLTPVSGHCLPRVLGCGAGLKSTVCLTRDRYGFLSQHIGDLENPKAHAFYDHTIRHLEKILDIRPERVAHDLHPDYYSTGYARRLGETGLPLVGVQHHHAHALACMAENRLDGEVIGITLDGTGYGTDGKIWGGEILTCTYCGFRRMARLGYLPMPGGDAAAREPWRMAAALLFKTFGREFVTIDIPFNREMAPEKLVFLAGMMENRVNCPPASSAGRLFDAVAALAGINRNMTYDSQAAMALEAAAAGIACDGRYSHAIRSGRDRVRVMGLEPMVEEIVDDLQSGTHAGIISAKFHNTLVSLVVETAAAVGRDTGLSRVVLSGGVFNNQRIFRGTVDGLEQQGFSVYTHSLVPCGDGGIALGQAMAAAAQSV